MAEDDIGAILKKQLDAKMGSFFEAQQRGVQSFASYLASRVQQEAPIATGLLSEQIDWRFNSVVGKAQSGYSKQTGISGKEMYIKLRNAKGQFAARETMSVEIGAINPTGWGFGFPVPYAGAMDAISTTVKKGANAGLTVPKSRSGGKLAIPTPSPLGIASGIYGVQPQRGVNVYARDVINNPAAFGLRSVFKSKSGKALLGKPLGKDDPNVKVNWFDRVIFALVDSFDVHGNQYLTGTVERERSTAVGKFSAEIARWKAEK